MALPLLKFLVLDPRALGPICQRRVIAYKHKLVEHSWKMTVINVIASTSIKFRCIFLLKNEIVSGICAAGAGAAVTKSDFLCKFFADSKICWNRRNVFGEMKKKMSEIPTSGRKIVVIMEVVWIRSPTILFLCGPENFEKGRKMLRKNWRLRMQ